MDKNILLLLEAIMNNNLYAKEQARKKGIAFYEFDLGGFLREKDLGFFANSEQQKAFANIPFTEIERAVKDAILKYTIGSLGRNRNLKISIPDYIEKWIYDKDRPFNTVYQELINNPYHTHHLLEVITSADEAYWYAKNDMMYNPLSSYYSNVIYKLEQERQLLNKEQNLDMNKTITKEVNIIEPEISQNNIDVLISAYEDTDKVFQSRGIKTGSVDLEKYLKNGNTGCFTKENNIRSRMIKIPFDEMEKEVKEALFEGAIAIFGTEYNSEEDYKNKIPQLFLDWINNNNNNYPQQNFEDFYQEIISNSRLYPSIIQTLKAARNRYVSARENYLIGNNLEPGTKEVIRLLEDEKTNLYNFRIR